MEFLGYGFLNNSVKEYLIALGAFLVFLLVFKIIQKIILRYFKKLAQRTKTDIDDMLIEIIRTVKPPFYFFLAFYLALNFLVINALAKKFIEIGLIIWVVFQAVAAVQVLIDYIVKKKLGEEKEKESKAAIAIISKLSKGILWLLAGLLILSNLGVNITSLVAGLGIGGIAIALALQNILSDLFSSFAIYFDKPFGVGDFIVVGNNMGSVEKIGIKTTRIRAPQGEELVISNKELTSARIQNFGRMKERRIAISLGVVYETPTEKLKKIPQLLKEIIESAEMTRLDRVHFKTFGDFALDFDIVFYAETPDYVKYLDIQQEINLKIKERFEQEEIIMAYPTQTVYLAK